MSNVFSSLENDATEKVDGENFNMNEKIVETHRSEKNKVISKLCYPSIGNLLKGKTISEIP